MVKNKQSNPIAIPNENIRSKSLSIYRKQYSPLLSICYSLRNMKYDDGLLNIPLFMVDYTQKILLDFNLRFKK